MLLELLLLTGFGAVRRFTSSSWFAHMISHKTITCTGSRTSIIGPPMPFSAGSQDHTTTQWQEPRQYRPTSNFRKTTKSTNGKNHSSMTPALQKHHRGDNA